MRARSPLSVKLKNKKGASTSYEEVLNLVKMFPQENAASTLPNVTKEDIQRVLEMIQEIEKQGQNEGLEKTVDDLTLSIWDFAGQDVYYITHQVFLVSRAIYILCFDLRHDLNKPVPVLEGEKAKEKFAVIREALKGKLYRGHVVKVYYAIDNSLRAPLDEAIVNLRDHITKVAKLEKYLEERFPIKWLHFWRAIEQLGKNQINFAEASTVLINYIVAR
ncbi:cyclic GMP-binding protein C-like [Anneissia japonica]|uniref:cyclic GMP-binding protein C-like n=1 Tax=Anneissia japonica TaxID=1529436 RepID=UPI0014256BC2|nr:cyclic GMP-binding protein C-like [Anneissia japonica]